MDDDDFGPLEGASTDGQGGIQSNANEKDLQDIISKMEHDFGQKRAKFMELYRQKEDALTKSAEDYNKLKEDKLAIENELTNLKSEIEGIKTAAAISESSKEDEISAVQRQCREEIASLQHIMKENIAAAEHAVSEKYEADISRWKKEHEAELQEVKTKFSHEREGFLTNVAKQLQKKVATTVGATASSPDSEAENLEASMKKAQEDAEILRSVVLPLEEEISALKSKLRDALGRGRSALSPEDTLADTIEKETKELNASKIIDAEMSLEEKVMLLEKQLETEKSSRTDLEMYVAVLNTQKSVLQDESEKLNKEIQEVCKILEEERREHGDLKRTWGMANDQFLESQRLMMMDMRRMESVLSAEQQRQITELKKKDADREAQEKRVRELEQKREAEERRRASEAEDRSRGSQTSLISTDALVRLDDELSDAMKRSQSNHSFSSPKDFLDSGVHETKSLGEDAGIRSSPEKLILGSSLTESQQKALTDPTPETEANDKLLASVRARSVDTVPTVGKRLVSDKEWAMLQQELKGAREKLGRPCDMCHNYETQLQSIQENEKKASSQVRTLERQLESERQALKNHQKYTTELEEKLQSATDEAEKEISTLVSKVQESERFVREMRENSTAAQSELSEQLKQLTENRIDIHKELTRLQEDNDSLVGKHSKHSQQLQEECINLPDNMEEMQLLLLKYREEIIQAKVAKEHAEDKMHSQIMFLKDQVRAEQQERGTVEEALTQEITKLQEQLAVLQSVKSELDRQSKVRIEAENKYKESEVQLTKLQAKSKQLTGALQSQVEEHASARGLLEQQVSELRAKVTSLQVDLDNSEAVQRDFVKLSQSLQIQLEKIRAAEQEVRWQFEDDVEDCNNCKQAFSVTRRKHHCRHCGRIFCMECIPKTVHSGPNRRPSKVCDVCHTILIRDATPYFSSEPPHTPD